MFRSKFEKDVAEQLDARGIKYSYEKVIIEYDLDVHRGGCLDCGGDRVVSTRDYLTDFYLDDLGYYIEVKGRFTSSDRTKMRKVKEQHPELDIRMLFMRDNTLNKRSKTRYSEWCDKYKIPWAIGTIPEDWID